jgi:hypothetical protein
MAPHYPSLRLNLLLRFRPFLLSSQAELYAYDVVDVRITPGSPQLQLILPMGLNFE